MQKRVAITLILMVIFMLAFLLQVPVQAGARMAPSASSATELINAVNALRSTYGLPPYNPNAILMSIAQQQAEYNLASGNVTHFSADGLSPYQRALQAGYPVAGDLNLGGFFSENITTGVGMTAEQAVEAWIGDAPHLNTMISSNLQDIGAGVAVAGDLIYYVIDCGLSTGGTPATLPAVSSGNPSIATVAQNTPNSDGSITYVVKPGDTTLGIALANNLTLDELLALNGLTITSVIFPGQNIILRAGYTPTPVPPTGSPTAKFTSTPWPTSSSTPTRVPGTPTPPPSASLSIATTRNTVLLIMLAAFGITSIMVFLGRGKKSTPK